MPSNSIKASLSAARVGTYETYVGGHAGVDQTKKALNLYMWNAQVSAAFLVPLHICEVVTRNALSEVLEKIYGQRWPWSAGFERSLPDPVRGYSPKKDLINARRFQPTTGKIIPELKFVFWQKLLTSRFDQRLWNTDIFLAFPNAAGAGLSTANVRQNIYDDLENIRKLRNRIAHHEPIITRPLEDDFSRIKRVVAYKNTDTLDWLQRNQTLLPLLTLRP
ncbi:hypothetical protein SDD15_004484 [Salmonella enterica]|nr:hypothetical protein [Salmonella enterica]ELU8076011.1 hypothetical protein [Salmonella enterica]